MLKKLKIVDFYLRCKPLIKKNTKDIFFRFSKNDSGSVSFMLLFFYLLFIFSLFVKFVDSGKTNRLVRYYFIKKFSVKNIKNK